MSEKCLCCDFEFSEPSGEIYAREATSFDIKGLCVGCAPDVKQTVFLTFSRMWPSHFRTNKMFMHTFANQLVKDTIELVRIMRIGIDK